MSTDKNTITKFKLFLDLDKEINYINEMNEKGWKLVYLKLGCFYTFVKTEPGEYVSLIYAESKENISRVTAFAAQCGYESIPHTNDGMGELMYLTGKKSQVSQDFVSDIPSRIECYKKIHKKLFIMAILYHLLSLLYIFIVAGSVVLLLKFQANAFITALAIIYSIFSLIIISCDINICLISHRYKKIIKRLQAENSIYE